MSRPSLTRAHRVLLGVVAAGATLISGIGFAGSYNAVRLLAMKKGFGAFSYAFPIGVDAGIVVLLALDLVLTWLRIPFPLLRQTAWLLTAATIAFNAAASWGDPLGMAMHAVIPVLFVVVVEASRHAVGRIAAITADRYMESVRVMRWILSPVPTFRLWRRMKLWELRSYDETVRLEQNRLVYRAQLRFRYGRGWRRSAPFQALLPLKLAKYGVPLDPTILDRIDGPLQVTAVQEGQVAQRVQDEQPSVPPVSAAVAVPTLAKLAAVRLRDAQDPQHSVQPTPGRTEGALNVSTGRAVPTHMEQLDDVQMARVPGQVSPWFKPPQSGRPAAGPARAQAAATVHGAPAQVAPARVSSGQGVSSQGVSGQADRQVGAEAEPMRIGPRPHRLRLEESAEPQAGGHPAQPQEARQRDAAAVPVAEPLPFDDMEAADALSEQWSTDRQGAAAEREDGGLGRRALPEPLDPDVCFDALIKYMDDYGHQPDPQRFAEYLTHEWGLTGSRPDGSVNPADLNKIWPQLHDRYITSGRE